ncbi:helix-turn-helix domain-containing protein, partial [Streptomyces sp. NPDC005568]|uniref:helix-turn-helix domain-containing protein n=1 Tax=Streptomyces sp. NPDC005568 TaxID=3156887 RepID=UPI0033B5A3B0
AGHPDARDGHPGTALDVLFQHLPRVHAVHVIDDRFTEPLPLSTLAASAGVSERTLTRLFGRATNGLTPLRYQQTLRLERAEYLIGHGSTLETAAREVGFEDARMLRRLRSRPTPGDLAQL